VEAVSAKAAIAQPTSVEAAPAGIVSTESSVSTEKTTSASAPKLSLLKRAEIKAARARERLADLEARNRVKTSKDDTRRKFILGRQLLTRAGTEAAYATMAQNLIASLAEHERTLFEDFQVGH
jgi:hypothetical protein